MAQKSARNWRETELSVRTQLRVIKEYRLVILELQGKIDVFLFISDVCSDTYVYYFVRKPRTVTHKHLLFVTLEHNELL